MYVEPDPFKKPPPPPPPPSPSVKDFFEYLPEDITEKLFDIVLRYVEDSMFRENVFGKDDRTSSMIRWEVNTVHFDFVDGDIKVTGKTYHRYRRYDER